MAVSHVIIPFVFCQNFVIMYFVICVRLSSFYLISLVYPQYARIRSKLVYASSNGMTGHLAIKCQNDVFVYFIL